MAFNDISYELDAAANIAPIVMLLRVSDGELAATPVSDKAVTLSAHVLNSGSTRKFGVHPRGLRLSREVGVAPNTFTKSKFLAIPSQAAMDAIAVGDDLSVGGSAWRIAGKRAQSVK